MVYGNFCSHLFLLVLNGEQKLFSGDEIWTSSVKMFSNKPVMSYANREDLGENDIF